MMKIKAWLLALAIIGSWFLGFGLLIGWIGDNGAKLWIGLTVLGVLAWFLAAGIEDWLEDRKQKPSRRL